jgi:hypothetical protein
MSVTCLGETRLQPDRGEVDGGFVTRTGERFYRICNCQRMQPFLMTVVSGYDHWMFVSSNGGLTCGRRDAEHALFPYYTDDKIHDARHTTGPKTWLRVKQGGMTRLWLPFGSPPGVYDIERNLYKNRSGNRLIFEEINRDLQLAFSYGWSSGDRFGFVRRAELRNLSGDATGVEVLDGLRNLLPAGVSSRLQHEKSTLVDAYKQAETARDASAAIFHLSSVPTDRAEPSEALMANVAWSTGLVAPTILLSEDQVQDFCEGGDIRGESLTKGRRCAFLLHSSFELGSLDPVDWYVVADVRRGPSDVVGLLDDLSKGITAEELEQDIDELQADRHFSNTLFNIMRGGTFYDGYRFPRDDFLAFVASWNAGHVKEFRARLPGSDPSPGRTEVLQAAAGDPDRERLALEYLPLTFSRRHGDPSRPWNRFSIDIRNPDGSVRLGYEGNWRDIFQNWEALSIAYPDYIGSFIAKFVNASTADGYNPYRIGRSGFDWEVLDVDDPWSNIGYWGDHQINYLLRLLELSRRYHPDQLKDFLTRAIFVYADVPYRIKPYADLLQDPRNTVDYDEEAATRIARRVSSLGCDGKLAVLGDGSIHHVTLLEKLLVTALVKLGNLVPDGGIWMNTQRPEWNDANNALVGQGLSMVTLCYLRRFLVVLRELLDETGVETFEVSGEVAGFLEEVAELLPDPESGPDRAIDAVERKRFMDRLGAAGQRYRERVYSGFSGTRVPLDRKSLVGRLQTAGQWLDRSISLNRRQDGLFHSYNLLDSVEDGVAIEHLDEMLEGQVAVLSSGFLEPADALGLIDTLRKSRLYSSDKNSYLLYPDRELPSYLQKNTIPADWVEGNAWLKNELDSNRKDYVERDAQGKVHFNGRLRNAQELRAALSEDAGVSKTDRENLCELWERVFRHRRFTGRSGAMYKYEGLGCIYWHMVSKLALALAEILSGSASEVMDDDVRTRLIDRYHDVAEGLGLHLRPDEYGAFPTDPYSHTTGFSGVQQPGMTGQVKEDIIARFAELGVRVSGGEVRFKPVMLRLGEFHTTRKSWSYSTGDTPEAYELEPDCLSFCLCGVPVVYRLGNEFTIRLEGKEWPFGYEIAGQTLGAELSQSLFRREGRIRWIEVEIPESGLVGA